MSKLKTIGLSALAGTLVSMSAAQAGGVSVGGTMEVSYTSLDSASVTGNPLGTKKNISFSGGGEFANGWTFGILHVQNDGMSGLSSSSMNINMGGIATLAYDSGTGGYGANSVDNIVPTAWEEIDYGLSKGITDVGQVSKTKGVVNFTLKVPGAGTGFSISYAPRTGTNHISDGGTDGGAGDRGVDMYFDLLNVDVGWFGWRLGTAAELVYHRMACSHSDSSREGNHSCALDQAEDEWGGTAYTSLKLGPLSIGGQRSYIDNGQGKASAVANNESWVAGAAFTFGNFLSLSYGKGEDMYQYNNAARELEPLNGALVARNEQVTQEFEGASAAINWGPLALKYTQNKLSNDKMGTDRLRDDHREINLSMAF